MKLNMAMSPKMRQKLQQTLSPAMIQMLKTFQYGYGDLVAQAEQAVRDNVLLEVRQSDELLPKFLGRKGQADGSDFSDYAASNRPDMTLYDHVLSQIDSLALGDLDEQLLKGLAAHLDERGYLSHYTETKAELRASYPVSDRKIGDMVKVLQTLEPEGVGARTLKECLLIQIDQQQFDDPLLTTTLRRLVSEHLDDLGANRYGKIAQALGLAPDGVEAAANFIRQNLDPNPGAEFARAVSSQPVVPSFRVTVETGEIVLSNLEARMGIRLGLSESHLKLLDDANIDTETRTYLEGKLQAAKTMIENIENRYLSLEKMAQYLVSKQRDFLISGHLYLQPLLQKEVAAALGLSPSTVSRTVSSKFFETDDGIFAFKTLCPRNHFGKTAERLKQIIRDLAQHHPNFSDEKLRQLLREKGMDIARRTVAKYRQGLGLASSYGRGAATLAEGKDFGDR